MDIRREILLVLSHSLCRALANTYIYYILVVQTLCYFAYTEAYCTTTLEGSLYSAIGVNGMSCRLQ